MSLTEVAPRTFAYVQGDGGWGLSNAGLVVGDGGQALLVDTFFDLPRTRALLDALPVRPTVVVNTHFNGDHCWGNELVADAPIVSHAMCREQLVNGPTPDFLAGILAGDSGGDPTVEYLQQAMAPFDFTGITLTPPTETFDAERTVDVGGRHVVLRHYGPAHTLGDCVAWVPDERVLFTGDLAFYRVCPLVWDGTVTTWLAALDDMLSLDPAVVVPGHGPVAGPEALTELVGYFRALGDQGRALHDAGMPVEEAYTRLDLGPYTTWVDFERTALNLLAVYKELDGEEPGVDAFTAFGAMATAAKQRRISGGCC